MSTSQFDAKASLGTIVTPSTDPFRVTGPLATHDTSGELRQVHVFVVIEQTTQDAGHQTTVAEGYGTGWWQTTWEAAMTVQRGPGFVPGPATGTAITVEYSHDPIGFETFAWADRITLTP